MGVAMGFHIQSSEVIQSNPTDALSFIYQASRQFQSILQERQSLPAWGERETILKLLSKHQVLVISGMTG